MAYNKYYLQKKQVSYDNGLTWEDVTPSETRQGAYIDSYQTLAECEGDYSKQYLTFESLEDNNAISWIAGAIAGGGITAKTISASTDNGVTWTAYTSTTGGTTIATLNAGDKLLIKGENTAYGHNSVNKFVSTGQFNAYGNIMSMISGDSFDEATTLTEAMAFQTLFGGCTGLTSAEHLILPATTLTDTCYVSMFNGCTNLTTAPSILPATTLTSNCYMWMFYNCTNLTTAPELPATTLANSCYQQMFGYCTSLVNAPELPATTLANSCYDSMFLGCTSLTTAPELPATTLANWCYTNMFNNCTSLTTAPTLSSTKLVYRCYNAMFYNCTSLSAITCLATDISATGCLSNWVQNVAATGTFVKDANTTWPTGVSGIPDGWTVQNNS